MFFIEFGQQNGGENQMKNFKSFKKAIEKLKLTLS